MRCVCLCPHTSDFSISGNFAIYGSRIGNLFCREEINLSDASNVKIFEYMRTLVNGAHWSAQKQLEKPNQTGRGGHLGCSNSFNFNFYKKYLKNEVRINSQGREQLHSIVDASCKSLRQFNYNNYMTFLKFFLPSLI